MIKANACGQVIGAEEEKMHYHGSVTFLLFGIPIIQRV
jgi:hypothetical protein